MIPGKRLAAALAVVLLVSTTNALAAADVTSVNIVDAPRPEPKWGYAPRTRRVQPGTWITWSNNGLDPHTVTAVDASFDSGSLDPSEGFSWFFDQPGTVEYTCTLHPWMMGKIIVGDGIAPPVADTAPIDAVQNP
jgi:plastocyanin